MQTIPSAVAYGNQAFRSTPYMYTPYMAIATWNGTTLAQSDETVVVEG